MNDDAMCMWCIKECGVGEDDCLEFQPDEKGPRCGYCGCLPVKQERSDQVKKLDSSWSSQRNTVRLHELAKKIEKKPMDTLNNKMLEEVKTFDIKEHKLIHEGNLLWKISGKKSIDLHVLLLDKLLVLLQRKDDKDEKYILKSHNTTLSTGVQEMKTTHSPVLKLENLLTRNVATDKRAFFLMTTSIAGPQVYELVAPTSLERKTWIRVITECVEVIVRTEDCGRRGGLARDLPIKEKPDEASSRKESDDEKERECHSDKEENGADSDDHVGKERLLELAKKIEKKPMDTLNNKMLEDVKTFDIKEHKLIHEGNLLWKISRTKSIDLHVLLLDKLLVLLQRQDDKDEKYILKSHNTTLSTGVQEMKTTHSPVLKLQSLLTRNVAADKRAFFLVTTSIAGPQIYELVAPTSMERKTWIRVITECVEVIVRVEGHGRRRGPALASTPVPLRDLPIEEKPDEIEEKTDETSSQKESDDEKERETRL